MLAYREVAAASGDWKTAKIKPNADTIAAAVEAAVLKGKYLSINLKFDKVEELSQVAQALLRLRQAYAKDEWGWDHARDMQDKGRATLLLLGNAGTGTKGHVDWTEAMNIAFALEEVGFQTC